MDKTEKYQIVNDLKASIIGMIDTSQYNIDIQLVLQKNNCI